MKRSNSLKVAMLAGLICLLSPITSQLVSASTSQVFTVKAEYSPSTKNNKFEIKSIAPGIDCRPSNLCIRGYIMHSVKSNAPPAFRPVPVTSDSSDEEQFYLQLNTPTHEVTLTNEYGQNLDVKISIHYVGATVGVGPERILAYSGAGHMSEAWVAIRCGWARATFTDYIHNYLFDFKDKSSGSSCVRGINKQKKAVPRLYFERVYIYPEYTSLSKPATITAGIYRGSVDISIGGDPSNDIYVGIGKEIDQTVTFNLEFTVTHMLKVEALGGTRVPMQPKAGWNSWLANTSPPTQISGESPFNLSTNSPFSMRLICQHTGADGNCALQSQRNPSKFVTVSTQVSLPVGISADARPVQRYPLNTQASKKFTPANYISGRTGTLHFEMAKKQVAEILNDGENTARRYSGDITVIWDATM